MYRKRISSFTLPLRPHKKLLRIAFFRVVKLDPDVLEMQAQETLNAKLLQVPQVVLELRSSTVESGHVSSRDVLQWLGRLPFMQTEVTLRVNSLSH